MADKISKFALVGAAFIIGGVTGFAIAANETDHSGHESHNQHGSITSVMPLEQGQSAFAAIAEIVSILERDPSTDWSKVNINALRDHLVDMNALTLQANVSVTEKDGTIIFKAEGSGNTLRALQNMVPAHATELDKMGVWHAKGEANEHGATLTIKPNDKLDLQKIRALGFFGLMATGAHHQPHHLGMANGTMVH